ARRGRAIAAGEASRSHSERRRCNFRPFSDETSCLGRSFHIQTCAILGLSCIVAPARPTILLMLLAERLVGEARTRRAREMDHRERVVLGASAGLFVVVASAMAVLLPQTREPRPLLGVILVVAYAVLARVRFEFG